MIPKLNARLNKKGKFGWMEVSFKYGKGDEIFVGHIVQKGKTFVPEGRGGVTFSKPELKAIVRRMK